MEVDAPAGCGPCQGPPAWLSVTLNDEGEDQMAIKKAPPTLTKPWVDVTSIKASLTRARELHS